MQRKKLRNTKLNKSIYAKENLAHEIFINFSKRIKENKSDAVIHHLKNKNNAIPFWLIAEEATFGELYYFVTSLKEDYRHYWIDQSFGKQYWKFIMGWIKSANIMRNTCAHYARLYARYFSAAPPKLLRENIKQSGIKAEQNKSLFAHLLTLKRIIQYNPHCHYDWNIFIDSLDQYITKNQDIISLIRMSFPVKWKEYLEII